MVEQLVGMQAQVPWNPYVALWSRLEGFAPEQLSELIADQAVFAHALRTGAVPRRSAALAMAVSGVLIVLDLLARGDR